MRKITIKGIWQILKEAGANFDKHNIYKMAASLAYYTIFSIGPMVIVIIFFADIFWGREAVEGTVYGQINDLVGESAAAQVQQIISNARLSGKSTVTAIIGFATLLIGATTVFSDIQDSINHIWRLRTKPKYGFLKILINRVLSFSIVVSLGFILLVSLVINGLIEKFMTHLKESFPDMTVVLIYIINLLLTFIIVTILFGIIFKVLPDAVIRWKDVLIGAMSTAGLFMLGKFGISYYIGSSDIGSTYGTAGSLVVILLWVYFSALILFFGAEFTRAWAAKYGTVIRPNRYAVWTKQVELDNGIESLKAHVVKEKHDDKIEAEQKKN